MRCTVLQSELLKPFIGATNGHILAEILFAGFAESHLCIFIVVTSIICLPIGQLVRLLQNKLMLIKGRGTLVMS